MKRIQFHRFGGPQEMRLEDVDVPRLGDADIPVRVEAASVNPVDWKIRQGAMKFLTGRKLPRAMGQDFSGVVEAVGRRVERFRAGDEVFGALSFKASGSFAERLVTQQDWTVHKPPDVTHEEAAALPVAGATAWLALVRTARLAAGQQVFINGAHGAVGQAATCIAKALGAFVKGRVGRDAAGAPNALRMDAAIDYHEPIPDRLTGRFDVVFDAHGGLFSRDSGRLLRRGGVVLEINPSRAKMLGVVFSRHRRFIACKTDAATLEQVADFAARGALRIAIGRKVPLSNGIELIRDLEAGRRVNGKGVIVVGGESP